MCKFAGFATLVVIGFVGGIGIGISTKLLLAFAILNVIFIFLLFLFRWIVEYAENIQWRNYYIEKINIPCVFDFPKDNKYRLGQWNLRLIETEELSINMKRKEATLASSESSTSSSDSYWAVLSSSALLPVDLVCILHHHFNHAQQVE